MAADRAGDRDEGYRRAFALLEEGDPAGLELLWKAAADEIHGLALWRTGSASDAADILQETFVRIAERRLELDRVRNPRGYVLATARRLTIDLARRRRRRPSVPAQACPFLEASSEDPERRLDAENVSRQLEELPPEQREVLYLRHFAGLTFKEIGRTTGVPTFTAASRHRLGLRRLRRRLDLDEQP